MLIFQNKLKSNVQSLGASILAYYQAVQSHLEICSSYQQLPKQIEINESSKSAEVISISETLINLNFTLDIVTD